MQLHGCDIKTQTTRISQNLPKSCEKSLHNLNSINRNLRFLVKLTLRILIIQTTPVLLLAFI